MVRRRCRLIVVIDAGCDPDFAFEDLGNAVRKIYIDLGVRITFEGLERLQNHPSPHPLSRAVLDAAARVNKEVAKVAKAAAQAAKAVANAVEHDAKDDEIGQARRNSISRDRHNRITKPPIADPMITAPMSRTATFSISSRPITAPKPARESGATRRRTRIFRTSRRPTSGSLNRSWRAIARSGWTSPATSSAATSCSTPSRGLTLYKALSDLVVHIPSKP